MLLSVAVLQNALVLVISAAMLEFIERKFVVVAASICGYLQKKDSGYIGAVCGLHKCEEEVFIDLKRVEENTLDTVCSWTRHNYVWF